MLPAREVAGILKESRASYRILRQGGRHVSAYQTVYYDDDALTCFHEQSRGRVPRAKLRIRHYPNRRLSFLELKTRDQNNLGHKMRVALPFGTYALSDAQRDSVRPKLSSLPRELHPQLWTEYHRSTLLANEGVERVTIDTNLVFRDEQNNVYLDELAIIEIKQAQFSETSSLMKTLKKAGLAPSHISKYAAATLSLGRHKCAISKPSHQASPRSGAQA